MKKLLVLGLLLTPMTTFASDYDLENITHYNTMQECLDNEDICIGYDNVQLTDKEYKVNTRNFQSTYCGYTEDPHYCNQVKEVYGEPFSVHTSTVITETKNYDVYRPKVTFEKMDSYSESTTRVCEHCN